MGGGGDSRRRTRPRDSGRVRHVPARILVQRAQGVFADEGVAVAVESGRAAGGGVDDLAGGAAACLVAGPHAPRLHDADCGGGGDGGGPAVDAVAAVERAVLGGAEDWTVGLLEVGACLWDGGSMEVESGRTLRKRNCSVPSKRVHRFRMESARMRSGRCSSRCSWTWEDDRRSIAGTLSPRSYVRDHPIHRLRRRSLIRR